MNSKSIDSLVSNIAAHWRQMNEIPRLGKMILLKAHTSNDLMEKFFQNHKTLKSYKCISEDIEKYKCSIGFIQKTNKKNEFEFVMCDYMYDSNYIKSGIYDYASSGNNKEDMTAPFTALFFDKWIYLEEIINL